MWYFFHEIQNTVPNLAPSDFFGAVVDSFIFSGGRLFMEKWQDKKAKTLVLASTTSSYL